MSRATQTVSAVSVEQVRSSAAAPRSAASGTLPAPCAWLRLAYRTRCGEIYQ